MFQVKINEFNEGDFVEGFFALREATLSTATNGKQYLRLVVGDATGTLSGNLWEADKKLFATLTVGGIIKLQAVVENYRGTLQLKITKLRAANANEVNPRDFIAVSKFDLLELEKELRGVIEKIGDGDYRRLLLSFFADKNFCEKFCAAPAARANHHAWLGGLLEHTVTLTRYGAALVQNSTVPLNADLLLTGIILHDVGKIHELGISATIEYSDYGRLLGHISIGVLMVEEQARKLPDFPPLKKWLVQHLILSHHGKYEYGSPILPEIPEALALTHLDNLDAKTVAAVRIINEDNTAGNWTAKSYMLETALFKGGK